jgi:hypothetical protein
MAAHAKLTTGRETRLFTLLVLGESLEASCRAINVSSTAIRKKMNRDPRFAKRVKAARENRPPEDPLEDPLSWRDIAGELADPLNMRPAPFDLGAGA